MSKEDYLRALPDAPDWIANPPRHLVKTGSGIGNLALAKMSDSGTDGALACHLLHKLAGELALETQGGRNNLLNKTAHTMGGFIGNGSIGRAEVESALRNACHRNGLMSDDSRAVEATLRSGLDSGSARPIANEHDNDNLPDWEIEPVAAAPAPELSLVSLTHPPGYVGEIIDWVVASAEFPSRELALGAALGWVATLAGRGFQTPSRARTNLYMVALAGSGYGKDHAGSCITSLALAAGLERFLGPARFMSASALRETLMAQASIISIQDEFGGILRQIDGPKVGIHNEMIRYDMLGLFSRAKDLYAGAAYAANRAVKLFNPNLSIYGMSTPSDFWSAVTSSRSADGFLPRFILFNVDAPKPKRVKPLERSDEPSKALIHKAREIYLANHGEGNLTVSLEGGGHSRTARVVNLDDEAAVLLDAFEVRIEGAMSAGEAKREPFYSRAREHALKLALTVAVGVNPQSPMIDREVMKWAIELAWLSTCSLIREGEGLIADNERQRTFNRIVDIIRKAGAPGITPGRLLDRLGGTVKRSERDELLDDAIKMGRARLEDRRPERLGRPSKRYVHRDFW